MRVNAVSVLEIVKKDTDETVGYSIHVNFKGKDKKDIMFEPLKDQGEAKILCKQARDILKGFDLTEETLANKLSTLGYYSQAK